jgi:uncharacterized protein YbjT (DUF2867 family)
MEEAMYVILGATGNTGSVAARKLLDSGKKVRVVGRDSKKLAPFASRGADAFATDVLDTDALSRAFAGAEGVYVLLPPAMSLPDYRAFQDQVTESIARKPLEPRSEKNTTPTRCATFVEELFLPAFKGSSRQRALRS